jgi:5-methylthioadenosine/S-adenosylhomocysteine deaminase
VSKRLLKGGTILSMDPTVGNLRGDVLIDGSRIERIDPDIDIGDCEVIDATDMVVMPGLIDAHRHLWYAGIRGGNMDAVLADVAAAQWGKLGPAFTPSEVHAFSRAGIADCLDNGVTTVFDFVVQLFAGISYVPLNRLLPLLAAPRLYDVVRQDVCLGRLMAPWSRS